MSENKYPIGGYAPEEKGIKRYTAEEVVNIQSKAYQQGYNEGWAAQKKEPKPSGAVWIKASDYDISKGGVLFYRFNGPTLKSIGIGHFVGDMFYGTHLDVFPKWDWKNLYILNESTPTTNNDHIIAALRKFVSMHETGLLPNRFTYEEGKKALDGLGTNNDAIEFGEFLRKNNMSPDGFGGWSGDINTNLHGSTTAELYLVWPQSKEESKAFVVGPCNDKNCQWCQGTGKIRVESPTTGLISYADHYDNGSISFASK